ncbi:MAG: hypothetical protein K6G51_02210 [Sphaerochaetaceae bacterium]|nr:hypothetical protein [Sphaerochaetaceae bacterium]
MSLFFTGLKHSGKTTAAKRVAAKLGRKWIDSDDLMLSVLDGMSVRDFYRNHGKEAFMELEAEEVKKYLDENCNVVMSLGGGAADNTALMDNLKSNGKIVYLSRPEELLLKKIIEKSGIPPFLDKEDIEGSWHILFTRRDKIYREYADTVIELGEYKDKDETVKKILEELDLEVI